MSEDTDGVTSAQTAQTSSSPEPQTVPKYRLDEEIAAKKALQENLLLAQQMLRQSAPAPRVAVPEAEPQWLKELQGENPNAYRAFKVQEKKLREQSAATFQVIDQQDRQAYLMEFGQDGSKRLQEVENKLEELRQRGIHNFNRGQIFLHMEGMDAVKSKRAPKETKPTTTPSTAVAAALASVDAPSSDTRSAGTLSSSSASTQKTVSLDDLERTLENHEF